MINDFKKGDSVLVKIIRNDSNDILEINGVIGIISETDIKIYHNFSEKKVIDFTIVKIKDIKKIFKVISKEIHSEDDLNLTKS